MSTATNTARRNLAGRIERFLRERAGSADMTGWQADQVQAAIELLEFERFADGEDVMMHAEKAYLFEPKGYAAGERRDVAVLRDRLAKIRTDQA